MTDSKRWLAAGVTAAGVAVALVLWRWGPSGQQVKLLDPAQIVVLRTPGGMLEVATLVKNEEFGWRASYTCPPLDCGRILGHTVSRIRVPVHYVYRVPLADTWELRLQGDHYVLSVPPPEPKLPPAMDTGKAEFHVNGSWATPSTSQTMEGMLRNVVPELNRRANQPEYLQAQRAAAARTVEEFARQWMQEQVKTPHRPIRVVFRDASSG